MPQCVHCSQEYEPPIYRNSLCSRCGKELKTCMNCRHYAPDMANACREPVSEPVQDKDRANFCDWFSPAAAPKLSTTDKSNTAKEAFAALFGNE